METPNPLPPMLPREEHHPDCYCAWCELGVTTGTRPPQPPSIIAVGYAQLRKIVASVSTAFDFCRVSNWDIKTAFICQHVHGWTPVLPEQPSASSSEIRKCSQCERGHFW